MVRWDLDAIILAVWSMRRNRTSDHADRATARREAFGPSHAEAVIVQTVPRGSSPPARCRFRTPRIVTKLSSLRLMATPLRQGSMPL